MVYISDIIASLMRMKERYGDVPIAKDTLINRVDYAERVNISGFVKCVDGKEESSHIIISIE